MPSTLVSFPTGLEDRRYMASDKNRSRMHGEGVVELTRVQPFEAEVIAARLRAEGIRATVGADSVYPSVTFADGVPVFVPAEDAPLAEALLKGGTDD
jgi:signal recognition particle subunit SEC65